MAIITKMEELDVLSAGDFLRQKHIRQIAANDNGILATLKSANIVLNGAFDRDTNNDGKPDNWRCYSASNAVVYSLSTTPSDGSGRYMMKIDQTSSSVPNNEYSYVETEYYPAISGRKYYIDVSFYVTSANDIVVIYAIPSLDGVGEGTAVTLAYMSGGHNANNLQRIISEYVPSNARYFKIRVGIVKYTSLGGNILYLDNVNIMQSPPPFLTTAQLVQTIAGSTSSTSWADVGYIDIVFPYIVNYNISLLVQGYVYTSSASYTAYLRGKIGTDVYTNSLSTTSTSAIRHILQSPKFVPYQKSTSGTYRRQVRYTIQGYISNAAGTAYVGKDAVGWGYVESE